MNVSLPTKLEEFVRHAVATGEFTTADEVVCEGLRLLQQQEAWKSDASRKIEAGWEQAKSGQLHDADDVRKDMAARKGAWKLSRGQ